MEALLLHKHELNVYKEERGRYVPIHKEDYEHLDDKFYKIRMDNKTSYAFKCDQCESFFIENSQDISSFLDNKTGFVYFSNTKFFNFCGFYLIGKKLNFFIYESKI